MTEPKHKLLFELGRGGTATVHLAVSYGPAGFSKLSVVKRLHQDLASDAQAVEMFTSEARVTALLNHPNIVQVHGIELDGDEYVIDMEYLEGQSLEAIVRRAATHGGLPVELGVWVLTQVLAGLHYAHELRAADGAPLDVVHRDVSPHNVFVTYEGTVKVLDFGIAKARDSIAQTETGLIKGKIAYMSPEQALREPVDRRADVFAVGVMLWQILTGKRLWAGLGDFEIFTRLGKGDIPTPRSAKPSVPEELDAICMRALAHAPADRYATAAEMQASLEHHLETTNPRAGQRQLARYLGELCQGMRESMKTRIDERLAKLALDRGSAAALGASDAEGTPSDMAVRAAGATVSKVALTGSRSVPAPPRSRATLAAVAIVAGGAVAGFAWLARDRSERPVTARPQSSAIAECAASRDCATDGDAARVCRAGRCIALASEDCRVVASPAQVANDATVWLGVMFPLSSSEPYPGYARVVELAREDFMAQTGGIPPASGVGASRPIGLVVCDDAVDAARVARHLAEDVRVPAVVGFAESREVIELAPSVFLPNDVLVLVSTNPSPFISAIPQPPTGPRLVWRTTLDAGYEAKPIAALVAALFEPRIRAQLGDAKKTPMRVALARVDNSVGLGLASALFPLLRFNDRSVIANGASFAEVVMPAYTDEPEPMRAAVDAIVAFRPHLLIVYAGGRDLTRAVYSAIEARWPRDEPMRPLYLVKDHPHRAPFFDFLAADAGRRRRFFGLTPPLTTPANVRLTMHYNEKVSKPVSTADAPRDPYDAFYLFAYAAFAAGDGPLTGSALARGIARLVPPGKHVDVGPSEIFEAFRVLRSGANIDLAGAETSLDFDLATGDPTSDIVLLCPQTSPTGVVSLVESGLVFDATTRKLRGRADCP